MKFTNWSLKAKLIAVVVFCLGILGASSFYNVKQFATGYEKLSEEVLYTAGETINDAIATQIFERYGDVQAFAINYAVKTMNGKEMQPYLDSYITLYGLYDLILVVDKNGNYVSSNLKDPTGKDVQVANLKSKNYKDEPWFKNTIEGKTTDDKERAYAGTFIEDFIDDPLIEQSFGEKRFGTSFSATIKNDAGEVVGVVTNRAGKRWIESEILSQFKKLRAKDYKDVEITLINGEGKLISFVLTDEKNGEHYFIDDSQQILQRDFLKEIGPAADDYLKRSKGYGIYNVDDQLDVVAFFKFEHPKWPAPLNWGVFVHDPADDALKDVYSAMNNFYVFFAASMFIGIAIALFFAIVISKSLNSLAETLTKNSGELKNASGSVAQTATELSEASTEQAAAIQETMAAVDEISAMVQKNAESAQRSQEVSQQSREAAEKGQSVMTQMLSAIDDIDQSNGEIAQQMQEANKELSEITTLINDIGAKTKVINDIVFQTKLLSFNASVEAARAGEYGKGFSVVAEEVGNLAQMSGNAAKEISDLLNTSVQKVNQIVEESKHRVEKMIVTSKEKVKTGSETAKECTQALNEILDNVQSVDSLVSEIVVASNEQSTGIREVSKAVAQMEQVTQQVSTMAQGSSTSSEQLSAQALELNSIVNNLADIVRGHHDDRHHEATNVVAFKAPAKKEKEKEKAEFASVKKKAANSDYVPSSDDPGFNE
jgi:methyl-accepting chemotaxis protein